MRYLSITAAAFLLTLVLTGCDTADNESPLESALNLVEPQVIGEAVVENGTVIEAEAETVAPNEARPEIQAEPAVVTEVEVSVDPETENRVIGQETVVADNPVMNPAGETLIQTAQVVFPNGKERIEVGKEYDLRWESEGIKAFDIEVHQFGRRTGTIAERVLAVSGSYAWTPERLLLRGNDFAQLQIVLIDADTGIKHDESDSEFMLVKP